MDRKTLWRLLVLPTLTGLAVTAAAYRYLPGGAAPTAEPTVPVVMARTEVPAKTRLTAELLTVEPVPARLVGPAALRSPDQAIGRITLAPLAQGEIVLSTRLAGEGTPAGLAYRIPDGLRAYTLRVDEVTGAGGFVQPGDRVDVIAVAEGEQAGTGRAVLLLEGVGVLAVGRDAEAGPSAEGRSPETYRYVTVAVTPEQALELAVAQAFGTVNLLLRPAAGDDRRAGRLERTTAILGR